LLNFLIISAQSKEVKDTKISDKISTIINNLTRVKTFSLRKKNYTISDLSLFKKYVEKNSAFKLMKKKTFRNIYSA